MVNKSNKPKSTLAQITEQVRKKYGQGAAGWACEYDWTGITSTGIICLDRILTYGGLPKGRIIEIIGAEGSGKSTLTYQIISKFQQAGGGIALYDTERRFFVPYAKACGVDIGKKALSIIYAEYAEQGLQICHDFIRSGTVDLVVVDSVAGLVPKDEVEKSVEDWQQGLQARVIGKALRKMLTPLAQSGATIIFVNQLRMKIGVKFGNPEVTPGGRALRFFASIRLDLRRDETIIDEMTKLPTGMQTKLTVKKAMGGEGRVCHYQILYSKGIDIARDLREHAVETGVVGKKESIYRYKEKVWRGKKALDVDIWMDKALYQEIYALTRKELKLDEH